MHKVLQKGLQKGLKIGPGVLKMLDLKRAKVYW